MYSICLNVKINTITCPGVWLCPKGQMMVKVHAFQQTKKTLRIHPKFPLIFYEKISFQKHVVGGVESVANVFDLEEIQIELIQWTLTSKVGIVLAKFSQHLRTIFDTFLLDGRTSISSKTDLLMCRTEYFPGIISPKINVTFELKIESYRSSDKILSSISLDDSNDIYHPLRQRRVCHYNSHYLGGSSLCSICDSFKKYTSPIYNSCFCLTPMTYDDVLNSSYCSWCGYTDWTSCKCCCCWKYHKIFH